MQVMKRRRWGYVLAAGLVTVLGIGALGFSAHRITAAGSRPAAKSTLNIWYSTDDPVESKWSTGLAPLFEAAHPNITVKLKVFDLDSFNDKMQDALASKTGPDLAYATPREPGIPVYVKHGELANLTAYSKQHKWSSLTRPGLLNSWNAPFGVWLAKFKGQKVNPKVQIYGVPNSMAVVGIVYNSKLLSQLHLSVPKTMAEFQHDAAVAKSHGDVALGLGNQDLWLGDDWYLTLANSVDKPSYLQQSLAFSPKFSYKGAEFRNAASQLAAWAGKGYFSPNFASLDAQGGIDAFFQGHTLFQLVSSTENAQILADKKQTGIPIGVFALPASFKGHGAGVMPYSGWEGWIVPKATHNKAAAEKWITFMLGSKATKYTLAHAVLPTTRVAASSAPTKFQRDYLKAFDAASKGVYLDAAPVPHLTAAMEANLGLLLSKKETAKAVQSGLQETYQSYGKKYNHITDIDGEF